MTHPNRDTAGGRAPLDLKAMAIAAERPTDELLVLYLMEAFLHRLSISSSRDRFVLKGGVLLAAYGDRRPTRDIDFRASQLDVDAEAVSRVICAIDDLVIADGVVFDTGSAISEVIREDAAYEGVRVRDGREHRPRSPAVRSRCQLR